MRDEEKSKEEEKGKEAAQWSAWEEFLANMRGVQENTE